MEEPGTISTDFHAVYVPLSADYPDYDGKQKPQIFPYLLCFNASLVLSTY